MKNIELRKNYNARINRVIDYINNNLDSDLSLGKLSEIAAFSKFHFHRIFAGLTNETLNDFIKRLRLTKAASKLRLSKHQSITDIALDCGFSSSAAFARAFKDYFNITPTNFRNTTDYSFINSNNCKTNSNNCKIKSNNGKDKSSDILYIDNVNTKNLVDEINFMEDFIMKVEVKELPEHKTIYVRHIGGYDHDGISRAWNKLCAWAGARNLFNEKTVYIGIGYDDPEFTPTEKIRYDACLTIDKDIEINGEIGKLTVAGGKYAVAHYEGIADGIKNVYHYIFAEWLPDSGYQPNDFPAYEIYYNDASKDGKFIMDVCIPVKPL